jgi:flagella basal body P-ring formation protein FlgA
MKLNRLVFTHPVSVFGGDSIAVLETDQTSQAPRCDSIEVTPLGLVITRGDVQAWVPCDAAEAGIVEPVKAAKGKAA